MAADVPPRYGKLRATQPECQLDRSHGKAHANENVWLSLCSIKACADAAVFQNLPPACVPGLRLLTGVTLEREWRKVASVADSIRLPECGTTGVDIRPNG